MGDEGQQIGSGDAEREVNKSVGLAGGANFFFLYKKKRMETCLGAMQTAG